MRRRPRLAVPLLLTLVAAGCQDEPEGTTPMCEPDFDYLFQAGELWGPCVDDSCTIGECYGSFTEDSPTAYGSVCVHSQCTEHPWCADTIDADGNGILLPCMQACVADTNCVNGQICDTNNGWCLWPSEF